MATPKKTTGQRNGASRRMWPVGKSNKEIDRALSNAQSMAQGNVGDSLESRLQGLMLGGGSDIFDGMNGYTGEFLQQSIYTGEESTPRGNRHLFNKRGRSETKIAWLKIKLVRNVYENDGQVASIIDLMADFATEGINYIHEDKGAQNFYRVWQERVKLRQKVRRVIIDLLISGNTFLYKVYAKLTESDKRAMRRYTFAQRIGDELLLIDEDGEETVLDPKIQYNSIARFLLDPDNKQNAEQFKQTVKDFVRARIKSQGEKIVEKDIKDGEKNIVPWKYISLNPLQMRPNENGTWSYLLGKEDMKQLANKMNVTVNETDKTLKLSLPDGLNGTIKPIKDVEAGGYFAEMEIAPERMYVIQWNKFDWNRWGGPGGLVWKAMPTITFKNTLRAMEQKTAQAAINMVYLWKLGDHKEGLIPTLEDYERLADMLKAPAATLNVLWNSAVTCDVVQPKMQDIFDPNRWEGLRAELTSQFGITQALVTGEGGNFSSSFISVQGLLERLQSIRSLLLEEWLLPEALKIKKAMGFQKMPKIVFNQMSLRDKTAEQSFLKELYDRGIISDETMMESMDRDIEVERSRILEQEEHLSKNDMGRKGPFDPNKQQLDWEKEKTAQDNEFREKQFEETKKMNQEKVKIDMQKAKQPKAPQPKGPGGKPKGPTGPQKKKRETKPKNMARVEVEKFIKEYDAKAKSTICEAENAKDYRSLSKASKEAVDEKVVGYLATLADGTGHNGNAFILLFNENRAAHIDKEGRLPTKSELHDIMLNTYMEMQGE